MPAHSKPAFLHCLSSLHSGTGQGIDSIDQPITREGATSLPYFPGSSLRGRLRDLFAGHSAQLALFGPESLNASDHAGAVAIPDARLLLFPVRALSQTFVYATSPFLLARYLRYLATSTAPPPQQPAVPVFPGDSAIVAEPSLGITYRNASHLIIEDLALPIHPADPKLPQPLTQGDPRAVAWANFLAPLLFPKEPFWQTSFKARFAILDDANLVHLARYATEVTTHVKIDDQTGTAEDHKLWYQENLPAETVLFTLISCTDSRRPQYPASAAELLALIADHTAIPLGGKIGTGHGLVRFLTF